MILSNDIVFWVSLPLSLPLCYRISKEIKVMRMTYLLKIQKIHDINFVNLIFFATLISLLIGTSLLAYFLSVSPLLLTCFSPRIKLRLCMFQDGFFQTLNDELRVLTVKSHRTLSFYPSKLSNSIVILIYFIAYFLRQWANSALTISLLLRKILFCMLGNRTGRKCLFGKLLLE